jgi:hypothetical protein
MKSTHHTFRVISVGIGLALLVVSGTAAMIATFSGPVYTPSAYTPLAETPAPGSGVFHNGDDTLLYERVARSDGSTQWVLVEPAVSVASLMLSGERLQPVSYALQGKPSGLNKVLKNCNNGASNSTRSKAVDAYDLSCVTLS